MNSFSKNKSVCIVERKATVRKDSAMNSENDEDDEDSSSKKRGKKNGRNSNKKGGDLDGTSNLDVLTEREVRGLYKAILLYGDISIMWGKLFSDGTLSNRKPALIKSAFEQMIQQSKDAVKLETEKRQAELTVLLAEKEKIKDDEKEAKQNNYLLKRLEKKAILFDFKGVKNINAELILQRPEDMKVVRESVPTDNPKYIIPKQIRPVHGWNCMWDLEEDSRLILELVNMGMGHGR